MVADSRLWAQKAIAGMDGIHERQACCGIVG